MLKHAVPSDEKDADTDDYGASATRHGKSGTNTLKNAPNVIASSDSESELDELREVTLEDEEHDELYLGDDVIRTHTEVSPWAKRSGSGIRRSISRKSSNRRFEDFYDRGYFDADNDEMLLGSRNNHARRTEEASHHDLSSPAVGLTRNRSLSLDDRCHQCSRSPPLPIDYRRLSARGPRRKNGDSRRSLHGVPVLARRLQAKGRVKDNASHKPTTTGAMAYGDASQESAHSADFSARRPDAKREASPLCGGPMPHGEGDARVGAEGNEGEVATNVGAPLSRITSTRSARSSGSLIIANRSRSKRASSCAAQPMLHRLPYSEATSSVTTTPLDHSDMHTAPSSALAQAAFPAVNTPVLHATDEETDQRSADRRRRQPRKNRLRESLMSARSRIGSQLSIRSLFSSLRRRHPNAYANVFEDRTPMPQDAEGSTDRVVEEGAPVPVATPIALLIASSSNSGPTSSKDKYSIQPVITPVNKSSLGPTVRRHSEYCAVDRLDDSACLGAKAAFREPLSPDMDVDSLTARRRQLFLQNGGLGSSTRSMGFSSGGRTSCAPLACERPLSASSFYELKRGASVGNIDGAANKPYAGAGKVQTIFPKLTDFEHRINRSGGTSGRFKSNLLQEDDDGSFTGQSSTRSSIKLSFDCADDPPRELYASPPSPKLPSVVIPPHTPSSLHCVVGMMKGARVSGRRVHVLRKPARWVYLDDDLHRLRWCSNRPGEVAESVQLDNVRRVELWKRWMLIFCVREPARKLKLLFASASKADEWLSGLARLLPADSTVVKDGMPISQRALLCARPLRDTWCGKPLQSCKRINNYLLLANIGCGSFGKVKLALSLDDRRFYALKIISEPGKVVRMKESLGEEVAARLRKLRHPSIVQHREILYSERKRKMVFVLEYMPRGELQDCKKLERNVALEEPRVKEIARDVVSGLMYLHSLGIVHRDIKPTNLLCSGDGRVRISDFGEAKHYGVQTFNDKESAGVAGTPAFLAPEFCVSAHCPSGTAEQYAVDVWSLGATLFYLAYGNVPFMADSIPGMYDAVCTRALHFPPQGGGAQPSATFRALLRGMLTKDPKRRMSLMEVARHPWFGTDRRKPLVTPHIPLKVTREEMQNAIGVAEWYYP